VIPDHAQAIAPGNRPTGWKNIVPRHEGEHLLSLATLPVAESAFDPRWDEGPMVFESS
jgi:hypothetical protein